MAVMKSWIGVVACLVRKPRACINSMMRKVSPLLPCSRLEIVDGGGGATVPAVSLEVSG